MSPKTKSTVDINELLGVLWDRKGTDLMLTVGAPPLIRVDGELEPIEGAAALEPDDTKALTEGLLAKDHHEQFHETGEVDFSFTWEGNARIRGNAFLQRGDTAIALRMIPRHIPDFDELGLPNSVQRFASLSQGLVLVTGPTGSGKSTTLASLIDWINRHRALHVLTIEDPIEYVHDHIKSAVNQREVGQDTESFASALRSALREDPDVLLVGEMRDLESIAIALTIAETGHLVFATLHTNDSAQALDRIVDVFPGERQAQIRVQLAASITGIVHQRLVPRIGGGLVAAWEVMTATSAVRNLIKEGKTNQLRNVIATHSAEGMQTLEAGLSDLLESGTIDHESALAVSMYPKEIRRPAPAAPPVPESTGRRGRRK